MADTLAPEALTIDLPEDVLVQCLKAIDPLNGLVDWQPSVGYDGVTRDHIREIAHILDRLARPARVEGVAVPNPVTASDSDEVIDPDDYQALVKNQVPDAFITLALDTGKEPGVFVLAPDETYGSEHEVLGSGKNVGEAWLRAWELIS